MDYSAANIPLWNVIIQIGIISLLVILSNILRRKVSFVRKSLMPTSVLAGFLLLGLRYTGWFNIDTNFLEMLTYHGLAVGFIALSLRTTKKEIKDDNTVGTAVKSGALIVSTYLIQGITGLLISGILVFTFMPDLFLASGFLLPMGYGQGPGQANNIGSTYEALGFVGGKSFGLAIAAAGFLCACIVGVIYLNIQTRRGKFVRQTPEELAGSVTIDSFQDEGEIPVSQSIDKLSIQIALILIVYLFTFLVIKGVTAFLDAKLPGVSSLVSPLLWGFNFIFGSLFAVLTRKFFTSLKVTKIMHFQYQNNYLLNRISGLFFDVMIICGIATINIEDLSGLWIPFILMAVGGGVVTFFYLKFMCKKLYPGYEEEGFLSMFGMLTGTISSGILLVREIDPEFKTPAADNLVSGSGTAIGFGAPMLILVGLAAKSTKLAFITLGLVIAYFLILLFVMQIKRNKNK